MIVGEFLKAVEHLPTNTEINLRHRVRYYAPSGSWDEIHKTDLHIEEISEGDEDTDEKPEIILAYEDLEA